VRLAAPFLFRSLRIASCVSSSSPWSLHIDPTPWPPAIARAAALGRTHAAANVAWLKTVQLLGSDSYAAADYPHLEQWIDVITRLDPAFEEPYFFGAALLVTDSKRAPSIDALLQRGEGSFPTVFAFPMMRGFLAQFGLFDAASAAKHYQRAAALPNAPAYLAKHAERLAKEGASCGTILADLKQLTAGASSAQAQTIAEQRFSILEHCLAGLIHRTSVSLRLSGKTKSPTGFPTLAEVEAELGGPVPHPPDRCWVLDLDKAKLAPCPNPNAVSNENTPPPDGAPNP
jgi:hypothetical protein